jgi:hypothetical protein
MAAACRALVFVVALMIVCVLPARGQVEGSPVERHCEFNKRLLTLTDAEWSERAAATDTYAANRQKLMEALDAIGGRHLQLRAELYVANRLTPVEHGRFAIDNKDEIDAYLKEHAALQDEIAALKRRIAASIAQCERAIAAAGRQP